ncbi:hypothetical protein C5Y93_14075 [Blastopirellula marina]|uniref:Uncharacterized protein n=1 Tax=Blastopirellula marina TaxID=124 RepID=A0A2S8GMA1_9BACT|nr:hypothetical protein C5Y93_14075 [Blastopirellula marina]
MKLRPQISLRTLLIVVTCLFLLLPWVKQQVDEYQRRRSHQRREQAIRRVGERAYKYRITSVNVRMQAWGFNKTRLDQE